MNIGLIQVRGLGDILIALPIARFYYDQGHQIHWPILDAHVRCFQEACPWVRWSAVAWDPQGDYMYQTPLSILKGGVDRIICLYHHLSSEPAFTPDPVLASVLKFDQYKYAIANVPFREKWTLSRCITRNPERERALREKLVRQERYVVAHLKGGDEVCHFDLGPALRRGYQIVEISEATDSIFDWLAILEGAGVLVLIDSAFSNLVDQLMIGERIPRIYIRRSHKQVGWTPVLAGPWQYL